MHASAKTGLRPFATDTEPPFHLRKPRSNVSAPIWPQVFLRVLRPGAPEQCLSSDMVPGNVLGQPRGNVSAPIRPPRMSHTRWHLGNTPSPRSGILLGAPSRATQPQKQNAAVKTAGPAEGKHQKTPYFAIRKPSASPVRPIS